MKSEDKTGLYKYGKQVSIATGQVWPAWMLVAEGFPSNLETICAQLNQLGWEKYCVMDAELAKAVNQQLKSMPA